MKAPRYHNDHKNLVSILSEEKKDKFKINLSSMKNDYRINMIFHNKNGNYYATLAENTINIKKRLQDEVRIQPFFIQIFKNIRETIRLSEIYHARLVVLNLIH